MPGPCAFCRDTSAHMRCGACNQVQYCNTTCQREHWSTHKAACKAARRTKTAAKEEPGLPSSWAVGLQPPDLYEWFANCYQMRCDDDYAWGGCYLHGPYEYECSVRSLRDDFLVFCVLAARRHVVPRGWKWADFLAVAAENVPYAFEKSDAQKRWGSENIFQAMMGGRSLRYTGEMVYGSSAQDMDTSDEHSALLEAIKDKDQSAALLEEVGGGAAWKNFEKLLAATRRFRQ